MNIKNKMLKNSVRLLVVWWWWRPKFKIPIRGVHHRIFRYSSRPYYHHGVSRCLRSSFFHGLSANTNMKVICTSNKSISPLNGLFLQKPTASTSMATGHARTGRTRENAKLTPASCSRNAARPAVAAWITMVMMMPPTTWPRPSSVLQVPRTFLALLYPLTLGHWQEGLF